MTYRNTYTIFSQVIGIISQLVCIIVILTSYKLHKRRKQSDYNWIFGFNTCFDYLYALIFTIVNLAPFFHDEIFVLISESDILQYLPTTVARLGFTLNIGALLLVPANLSVHFWYRYNILCNIQACGKRRYVRQYAMFGIWVLVHMVVFYYHVTVTHKDEHYKYIMVNRMYHYEVPSILGFEKKTPLGMMLMLDAQVMFIVQYSFILYYGYKIIKKMKEKRMLNMSSTQKAQQYVIRVMFVQALYPFLVFFLPITLLMICIRQDYNVEKLGYAAYGLMQLFPLLNCLSILLLVPSYRRKLMNEDTTLIRSTIQKMMTNRRSSVHL
ncbi:unnamed protein product [Bursaphelenchus okinawaensis]|uniref:G_PROTEIN_RECEP_F1_2 domain-containing protein n=1 Tax=Bursaphelenchus okinawaensis TaxID=465554 RepID=A0A811KCC0_9BILA|nr:unnamed protein product [Bursaphelenchus okinawaensis]CAG9100841.1 unnamed protein product [Bursaphelenchus okinawaensis]